MGDWFGKREESSGTAEEEEPSFTLCFCTRSLLKIDGDGLGLECRWRNVDVDALIGMGVLQLGGRRCAIFDVKIVDVEYGCRYQRCIGDQGLSTNG